MDCPALSKVPEANPHLPSGPAAVRASEGGAGLSLLYFDASALVKGYVQERGSECVAQIFEAADHVFTCKIAFAEVMATFGRKRNEERSQEAQIDQLANQFRQDWESIAAVDLSSRLLDVVRRTGVSPFLEGP